jgi:hypothetical protein
MRVEMSGKAAKIKFLEFEKSPSFDRHWTKSSDK